jgi:uncharacterized protein (DUF2147 family)
MKNFRIMLAAVTALTMSAGVAGAASVNSPEGIWITNGGESKYEIKLCGDGDDLCAKMVWVNDTALGQKLKPYMGENLLLTAPRVANNKWRGQITMQGRTVKGSIELLDAKNIHVRGCEGMLCQGVELLKVSD